jgi:hypothetical protein
VYEAAVSANVSFSLLRGFSERAKKDTYPPGWFKSLLIDIVVEIMAEASSSSVSLLAAKKGIEARS